MMASKFFSSSKMSKTGKNQKIRYKSVITKKSAIYFKIKNQFKINTVCYGQFATCGYKNACVASSDATCCAILAVNTWFFSLREMPPSNMASRSPKNWYLTQFYVPIRLPKTAHLIMMASKLFSSSKMSKTGKNQKSVINPL